MDDFMNEAADARREAAMRERAHTRPRRENEILKASGKVISSPETGENTKGRRWCTFEMQEEDGNVVKLYTVRFYADAVRLGVGDDITVKYIHDGPFNNLVGSIVLNGEGRVVDNILNTVRRIDDKVSLVLDNQVKVMSRIEEMRRKLDWLADEAAEWDKENGEE